MSKFICIRGVALIGMIVTAGVIYVPARADALALTAAQEVAVSAAERSISAALDNPDRAAAEAAIQAAITKLSLGPNGNADSIAAAVSAAVTADPGAAIAITKAAVMAAPVSAAAITTAAVSAAPAASAAAIASAAVRAVAAAAKTPAGITALANAGVTAALLAANVAMAAIAAAPSEATPIAVAANMAGLESDIGPVIPIDAVYAGRTETVANVVALSPH